MNRKTFFTKLIASITGLFTVPAIVKAEEPYVSDVNLTQTFDARVWAREWMQYIRRRPSIATNEECMLGWFANAIMAGYDEAMRMHRRWRNESMRVLWIPVTDQPLRCGDMWASEDPNTPEQQGKRSFNLIMQAVHPSSYGHAPNDKHPEANCFNGGYWRPVDLV